MNQPPPYGPPGYPQQQYTQPQYQQPQQGYGPPPQQQYAPQPQVQYPPGFGPTQAPGQAYGQQPQQQAPSGAPGFYIPSQEQLQRGYEQAAEMKARAIAARNGDFSKLKFFTVPGPNGGEWKTAFVGYTGGRAIYIMPSWAEGKLNFVERTSHFWKSKQFPKGMSINGGGPDSLVTKAYKLALENGVKSPWLRASNKIVYQGFPYEYDPNTATITGLDPSQCVDDKGQIRPLILEVGMDIHGDIQQIAKTRKFVETFHPDYGRPIAVLKTKTGNEAINVEWKVIDLQQQPLADVYRPGLANLFALDELFKPATLEEQIKAIQDAGLPMPAEAGGFQGQSQTGYQPAPQHQQYAYAQGGYQQPMQPPTPAQQVSYQQAPLPPNPNPYQQQPQGWPPAPQILMQGQEAVHAAQQQFPQPAYQGQMQPPPFMTPAAPKPLPPLPAGVPPPASTPMLPLQRMPVPSTQAQPQQGYGQQQYQQAPAPAQQPPQAAPQHSSPSPEELQAQLLGDSDIPF